MSDSGVIVTPTYAEPGTYLAELRVTHRGGLTTNRIKLITVVEGVVIIEWMVYGGIVGAKVEGTARDVYGERLESAE